MKVALQLLLALAIAALLVLGVRSLAFTVYTVDGQQYAPELLQGDRIAINRWSYGLRTGGSRGLFPYGRILKSKVRVGDIVAFDSPVDTIDGLFIARCKALPGDTLTYNGAPYVVPGREATCAKEDYYWFVPIGKAKGDYGPIPESCIIGRVISVIYHHDDTQPFYTGYGKGYWLE